MSQIGSSSREHRTDTSPLHAESAAGERRRCSRKVEGPVRLVFGCLQDRLVRFADHRSSSLMFGWGL